MKLLSKCQANMMQAVLLKIDRRSKPIKKQKISLDIENLDILTLL